MNYLSISVKVNWNKLERKLRMKKERSNKPKETRFLKVQVHRPLAKRWTKRIRFKSFRGPGSFSKTIRYAARLKNTALRYFRSLTKMLLGSIKLLFPSGTDKLKRTYAKMLKTKKKEYKLRSINTSSNRKKQKQRKKPKQKDSKDIIMRRNTNLRFTNSSQNRVIMNIMNKWVQNRKRQSMINWSTWKK